MIKKIVKPIALLLGFLLLCFLFFQFFLYFYTHHGEEVIIPNVTNIQMQEAKRKLVDVGLTYKEQDTSFNSIIPTGFVAYQYPPPNTRVKIGRTVSISPSSFLVQENTLPNLVGKNLKAALFMLNQTGIAVKDTLWSDSGLLGMVLEQRIGDNLAIEGTLLKITDSITLVVGTKNTARIRVPSLIGVSEIEARIILQSRYLRLGQVNPSETGNESVIRQEPAPLDSMGNINRVPENTPVSIWF